MSEQAVHYRAKPEEMPELLDLSNYIFGIDIRDLIPRAYTSEAAPCYYVTRESDGRLKALCGSFPIDFDIGGEIVEAEGIGSVSVHKYCRGKGYMKLLMNMAIEDMKARGIAFSFLSGQRQRYEYFGYGVTGSMFFYTIIQQNIAHGFGKNFKSRIELREIKADDMDYLAKALELYHKEPYHGVRNMKVFDFLRNWESVPYAILKDDVFLGYVCLCPKPEDADSETVYELILVDEDYLKDVLAALMEIRGIAQMYVKVAPWELDKIKFFEKYAEFSSVKYNAGFRIFDYVKTLGALMRFKARYAPMPDGELSVHVKGEASVLLGVKDGKAEVVLYGGKCDIEIDPLDALTLFFAPASCYHDITGKLPLHARLWFPLPLYIPKQDNV